MMMLHRFVERVLNSPQTRCQFRWVLCRANARGESIAVCRAAHRLFQMCGPATTKHTMTLALPSTVQYWMTTLQAHYDDCLVPAVSALQLP